MHMHTPYLQLVEVSAQSVSEGFEHVHLLYFRLIFFKKRHILHYILDCVNTLTYCYQYLMQYNYCTCKTHPSTPLASQLRPGVSSNSAR